MLRILTDGVPARRSGAERDAPMVAALSTLTVIAEGQPEEGNPLLARAELAATTPLHRMITAIAGVHVARRSSLGLDMAGYGLRSASSPAALLCAGRWFCSRQATARPCSRPSPAQAASRPPLCSKTTFPGSRPERTWPSPPASALTAREREVLSCLAETERRSEIASRLFVSPNTVKSR